MILLENIDIKFIHKFHLLGKNCTKNDISMSQNIPWFWWLKCCKTNKFPSIPIKNHMEVFHYVSRKDIWWSIVHYFTLDKYMNPKMKFYAKWCIYMKFHQNGFLNTSNHWKQRWHTIFLIYDAGREHWYQIYT